VRITVPHVFDFGEHAGLVGDDLVRPEAWDALRVQTTGPFGLAADRPALEAAADARPEIEARARALDALLRERGVGSVASYGAGAAVLELWLHRLDPGRAITLTDYAPQTAARLAELLPELQVRRHDLLAQGPLDADLHLFHRIDTEFTNRQWRGVLRRFEHVPVLVLATEVIDWRRAVAETVKRVRNRRITRAGWIRTPEAFEALWRPTHDARRLRVGDLEAWELSPRLS
jgi:hypothetical protein